MLTSYVHVYVERCSFSLRALAVWSGRSVFSQARLVACRTRPALLVVCLLSYIAGLEPFVPSLPRVTAAPELGAHHLALFASLALALADSPNVTMPREKDSDGDYTPAAPVSRPRKKPAVADAAGAPAAVEGFVFLTRRVRVLDRGLSLAVRGLYWVGRELGSVEVRVSVVDESVLDDHVIDLEVFGVKRISRLTLKQQSVGTMFSDKTIYPSNFW